MARLAPSLGRRRDWPQVESINVSSVAAGSATDYEKCIFTVPDLTKVNPAVSGTAGDVPINSVAVRMMYIIPDTTITGQATNFFTFNFLQRRNLAVNTTGPSTIASGSRTITPASMNNINLNSVLVIDTVASGVQETVTVSAVTATTFTATFSNAHTGPFPIVNGNLASFPVTTSSATTVTAGTMAVTPLSMSNIAIGTTLRFSGGTGATEDVIVNAVTATTFTATFANGHSGAYTITSSPIGSIVFSAATVVATSLLPTQLSLIVPLGTSPLIAGDVLTLQRVSSNATGLATPATTAIAEWVPIR